MTPDQLTAIIDRMTPGPWRSDSVCPNQAGPENGPPVLGCDFVEDAEGVVALRNHATALIECARVLQTIAFAIEGDPVWENLSNRIDAALKSLKEVKP